MRTKIILGLSGLGLIGLLSLVERKLDSSPPPSIPPDYISPSPYYDKYTNLIALVGVKPANENIRGLDYLRFLESETYRLKKKTVGRKKFTTNDLSVVLYSTNYCGFCEVWKNVPFEGIESYYPGSNFYIEEELILRTYNTYPMIEGRLENKVIFRIAGYPSKEALCRKVEVSDILKACIDGILKN